MVFKFEMQPNQNLVNLLGVQLCIRDLGVNGIFHYFIRTEVFISDVIYHRSIQVVVEPSNVSIYRLRKWYFLQLLRSVVEHCYAGV